VGAPLAELTGKPGALGKPLPFQLLERLAGSPRGVGSLKAQGIHQIGGGGLLLVIAPPAMKDRKGIVLPITQPADGRGLLAFLLEVIDAAMQDPGAVLAFDHHGLG
jgi:hypothetical protein